MCCADKVGQCYQKWRIIPEVLQEGCERCSPLLFPAVKRLPYKKALLQRDFAFKQFREFVLGNFLYTLGLSAEKILGILRCVSK